MGTSANITKNKVETAKNSARDVEINTSLVPQQYWLVQQCFV